MGVPCSQEAHHLMHEPDIQIIILEKASLTPVGVLLGGENNLCGSQKGQLQGEHLK